MLAARPLPETPRFVAGADMSFHPSGRAARGKPQRAWACVVVFRAEPSARGRWRLTEVERACAKGRLTFPYVPGLLSFREIPLLLKAFAKLKTKPDLVVCDAHGTAHPRGFGEACHLGVLLGIPTVGAAKSILAGSAGDPPPRAGAWTPLEIDGRAVGAAVRTRDGVRPIYASPGHLMDLRGAVRAVLACADGTRLPVPTREADRWSKALRREAVG